MYTLSLPDRYRTLTDDPFVLGTILTSCSTVAFAFYHFWKSSQEQNSIKDEETIVRLLSIEQVLAGGGGGDNAMSTFTWFRQSSASADDTVLEDTIQLLKGRFYQIIKANPWLIGRILKRDGEHALVYPKGIWLDENEDSMNEYFFGFDDKNQVSLDTPLDQLGSKMSHLMLKTGPKETLCRVTIIPSDKPENFAVLFTMSHVYADGATFFQINNMLLNAKEAIVSLNPQRITTTEDQQIQVMGGEPEYKILQSGGFIANMVKGVFASAFQPSKKASGRFYLVNQDGMKEEKKKYQTKDDFVSTNDVLSSWFFQNSTCQHGLMAVNWRGKLEGHTDRHAGNYENVLFYRQEDSKTPDLIRKSLTPKSDNDKTRQYQRQVTHSDPVPDFWGMANGSVALASNWSSFAKPSSIAGWEEEMQIPLYDTSKLLPLTLSIMLIFRAGPHGMGVFVAGSPDKLAQLDNKDVPFLSSEAL